MQLLPIIIVVSLLGFFVALTILIFVGQYLRTRDRRKRQRPIVGGNEKPTRKLTVRSGKVVPRSEAMQTASTRNLESLDLSSLRSGQSLKSKATVENPLKSIHQTERSERRRSSAYTDLEAQENELEKRWEENMKAFHVDERFMESWKAINSHSKTAERTRSVPKSQVPAISGQRIAESLRKGYNGPSALSGQSVEVPTAPLPKPPKAYTLSRNTTNGSGVIPPSKAQKGEVAPENIPLSKRLQRKSDTNPNDNPVRSPRVSFVLPKTIQIPLPVHAASVHSPHAPPESPIHNTPVSFFSTSESPASSAISQVTPSLVNAPPPSPTDISPSQILQPNEVDGKPQRTPSTESRRNRLLEIDTNIPNLTDTSFIDSADSSDRDASDRPRGQSVMSNHSVLTFASSELSSIWTFGNAQPVAIVAGVTPRTLAMHPNAMRPKSKFGRRLKSRKEKALPVIPKSPLRLESRDVS